MGLLAFVFFSFLRVLLTYNSHTVQFTHLKYIIQWLLVYSQSCVPITTIKHFQTFSLPHKKSLPILQLFSPHASIPLSPRQLLIYILSQSTYLGCFIKVESYDIWFLVTLLSLRIMFSSFIHLAVWISTSFLFTAE